MDDTKTEYGLQTAKEGQGKSQQSSKKKTKEYDTFFFFPFTANTPDTGRNRDETFQNLAFASG